MIHARLFGDLAVWVDGREVPPLQGLRPRSLMAYLLLHPGLHPRTRLAGRFWPDVLETSARASLRSALWSVRAALEEAGGAEYLHADRSSVGITPKLPRTVDAEEFERLVSAGDPTSLRGAVDIAAAPLLADLADEWALDAQDAHRERLVDVLERLAAGAEDAGDMAGAVRWTRAVLGHDRLRESAHRALMRRLDACGERAQALTAYRRARAVLAAELGVAPSSDTRALAETLRGDHREDGDAADPTQNVDTPRRLAVAARLEKPVMIGRDRELDMLLNAWTHARAGRGGMALVSGPPGIGKTHLVAALVERARADGARIASGAALELAGAPPLAPWLEALRDLIAAATPPPDVAWPSDLARLSAVVESTWHRAPGPPALSPDLERVRIFEAVLEMVAWSADTQPLVLVLEDLHRADSTSLALLAHIGRRLDASSALIVVTRRLVPGNPELDLAIDAIRRRGGIRVDVELDRLADADVARLVGAAGLNPDLAARVVVAAEGNPLLASEGARAAAAGRDPAEGLHGVVRGPLGQLTTRARTLVDVIAAAGRPLDLGEALDAIGDEDLHDPLEEGIAAGLLDHHGDRRVRFVHDLVRRACYTSLSEARRADAHRRLAVALTRRPHRQNAEIARHMILGGNLDAARRHLAAAAHEARGIGALDETAAFLREALELASTDGAMDAELWLALADVSAWRADRDAMDDAFAHAVTALEVRHDTAGLATAYAFRARWLHTTLCYPAEALAASTRSLEMIGRTDEALPEAHLLALTSAAWAQSVAGDPAVVDGLIQDARTRLQGMGDRSLEAELEHARGTALVRSGAFAEAIDVCERAAELAHLAGRPQVAAAAMLTAACAAACVGDVDRVLSIAETVAARPWPGRSLEAQVRAARAYALSRLGRMPEAIRAARENVEPASGADNHDVAAVAEFDLGSILLAAGSHREAAERLGAALEVVSAPIPRAVARLRLSEAFVSFGNLDCGERELGQVPFEPIGPADAPETLVAQLSRVQGLIAAARGDAKLAARRFAEAERVWRRMSRAPSGDAYAAVLLDLGRPPIAGLVEPARELARLARERALLDVPVTARRTVG